MGLAAELGSILLATLMLQPGAVAVDDSPVTQLDEIVVVGSPLRDLVRDFVDEVADPVTGRGLARFNRIVCVGVVNLRRDVAQAMVDRISAVALDAGLDIGEPGCSPNLLVIAAEDGRGLATGLVEAMPRAFNPGYAGASQSLAALRRFQDSDAPVRAWHVSIPVDTQTGAVAVRMPGHDTAPRIRTPGGLLRTTFRNDFQRAIVIVGIAQAGGLSVQQLGDHVAMVSLAQIDAEADTSRFQTILNVFDNPDATPEMTEWDRSYLRSLYGSELNQRHSSHQTGSVGQTMIRDRQRVTEEP